MINIVADQAMPIDKIKVQETTPCGFAYGQVVNFEPKSGEILKNIYKHGQFQFLQPRRVTSMLSPPNIQERILRFAESAARAASTKFVGQEVKERDWNPLDVKFVDPEDLESNRDLKALDISLDVEYFRQKCTSALQIHLTQPLKYINFSIITPKEDTYLKEFFKKYEITDKKSKDTDK